MRGAGEEPNVRKNGKRSTSSTSKIKKIRAIRKNRIENGIRALSFLVNPHSKGLSLFRSGKVLADRVKARIATTIAKVEAIKKLVNNISIRVWLTRLRVIEIASLRAQRVLLFQRGAADPFLVVLGAELLVGCP